MNEGVICCWVNPSGLIRHVQAPAILSVLPASLFMTETDMGSWRTSFSKAAPDAWVGSRAMEECESIAFRAQSVPVEFASWTRLSNYCQPIQWRSRVTHRPSWHWRKQPNHDRVGRTLPLDPLQEPNHPCPVTSLSTHLCFFRTVKHHPLNVRLRQVLSE